MPQTDIVTFPHISFTLFLAIFITFICANAFLFLPAYNNLKLPDFYYNYLLFTAKKSFLTFK